MTNDVAVVPTTGPPRRSSPGRHAVLRIDVAGLDILTPGVTVLAPRHGLLADEGRIVLTETPAVRRVAEIVGLQALIDTAFTGSPPESLATLIDPPFVDDRRVLSTLEVRAELRIHADDLNPGDVVDYCGHLHHVTRVDRGAGLAWPVAYDGTGWAMALSHELIVLHRTGP